MYVSSVSPPAGLREYKKWKKTSVSVLLGSGEIYNMQLWLADVYVQCEERPVIFRHHCCINAMYSVYDKVDFEVMTSDMSHEE